jgi:hypothetical protein
VANLLALRKGMTKWGVNPADLAYIVGVSAAHALLADTNLLTVDKFGPNATILNGQIGAVAGVPVIVSEWVREDLNATGVYDGITTTKTFNLCVNRNEWAMGTRMGLDFKISDELYLETFQRVIVGFSREDFQSIAVGCNQRGHRDVLQRHPVVPLNRARAGALRRFGFSLGSQITHPFERSHLWLMQ